MKGWEQEKEKKQKRWIQDEDNKKLVVNNHLKCKNPCHKKVRLFIKCKNIIL